MKVSGRVLSWGSTAIVVCLTVAAGVTSASSVPAQRNRQGSVDVVAQQAVGKAASDIPPGVLPRAAVSDDELTQCRFRGCAPDAHVWLVLQQEPPGSFPYSGPAGVHPSSGADAWSLFPVGAATGVARGDIEFGAAAQLGTSPWGRLHDLASTG